MDGWLKHEPWKTATSDQGKLRKADLLPIAGDTVSDVKGKLREVPRWRVGHYNGPPGLLATVSLQIEVCKCRCCSCSCSRFCSCCSCYCYCSCSCFCSCCSCSCCSCSCCYCSCCFCSCSCSCFCSFFCSCFCCYFKHYLVIRVHFGSCWRLKQSGNCLDLQFQQLERYWQY